MHDLFENRIKRFKTEYSKLENYIKEAVSLQEELKIEIENKMEYLNTLDNDTDMEINVKYITQNSIVSEIEKSTKQMIDISNNCKTVSQNLVDDIEKLIDEMHKKSKHNREDISKSVYKKITDN